MSGVWQFSSNGLVTLVENPLAGLSSPGPSPGRKVLVYTARHEVISSYEQLDRRLREIGWQPYARNQRFRQYHRGHEYSDLITLPQSFDDIRTIHMYDIVVKTRASFRVQDS